MAHLDSLEMKTITVAQLRQNPTMALDQAADGETYVVTKHGHPIAQLVPPGFDVSPAITPARKQGGSNLVGRSGGRPYEDTEALLGELAADR